MSLREWGTWQRPIMDPVVLAILSRNTADVEAIVQQIGIGTLFKILPHVLAILNTVKEAQKHA